MKSLHRLHAATVLHLCVSNQHDVHARAYTHAQNVRTNAHAYEMYVPVRMRYASAVITRDLFPVPGLGTETKRRRGFTRSHAQNM